MTNPAKAARAKILQQKAGDTQVIHLHAADVRYVNPVELAAIKQGSHVIACGLTWGEGMATGDPSEVTCPKCIASGYFVKVAKDFLPTEVFEAMEHPLKPDSHQPAVPSEEADAVDDDAEPVEPEG